MPVGTPAPDFRLPGVDGGEHALSDYADARALLVVFTCNHCPYAIAVESRLIDLQAQFAPRGLQLVAISSNDHPKDTFELMRERAAERGFNFPYLYDADQTVARAYDAACTPDPFLFGPERRLAYNGRIDDNWREPGAVTRPELAEAVEHVLAGEPVPFDVTPSMGCSIKWRPEA